jgi:hypothetical protein
MDQKPIRLVYEAEMDGLRFWQEAVVHASDGRDAETRMTLHLAEEGAVLVAVDPEETAVVPHPSDNPETAERAAPRDSIPESGVIWLSGRIWIRPTLRERVRVFCSNHFGAGRAARRKLTTQGGSGRGARDSDSLQ